MSTSSPSTYLIDITPLFIYGCTKRNLDMSSEYVGGFDKLTDLCCHIGLMKLKNKDQRDIESTIDDIINSAQLNSVYSTLLSRTIAQYSDVIYYNFLRLLAPGEISNALNHIVIHSAEHDYDSTSGYRKHISMQLNATTHWHLLGRV